MRRGSASAAPSVRGGCGAANGWHVCERLAIELARENGEGDGFAADITRQLFFSGGQPAARAS